MTQDIVRESTMKFILESERTMNLAAHIEDALLEIRKQSFKLAIKGIENYFSKWSENKDWKSISELKEGNIMRPWKPLILRKNSWSEEDGRHGPSGVQLISGQPGWKEVYIRAVFYSRTISEQDKKRIESLFKGYEGKLKLNSSSMEDYLMTGASMEDELGDWTSPKFSIRIRKQPDKIACDLATHMIDLAEAVDYRAG